MVYSTQHIRFGFVGTVNYKPMNPRCKDLIVAELESDPTVQYIKDESNDGDVVTFITTDPPAESRLLKAIYFLLTGEKLPCKLRPLQRADGLRIEVKEYKAGPQKQNKNGEKLQGAKLTLQGQPVLAWTDDYKDTNPFVGEVVLESLRKRQAKK